MLAAAAAEDQEEQMWKPLLVAAVPALVDLLSLAELQRRRGSWREPRVRNCGDACCGLWAE